MGMEKMFKEQSMSDEMNREEESFPEEAEHLSDEELEEAIVDRILDVGEIDTENLHIQCQNGVVSVEGVLPSAEQYQDLIGLLRDELQLEHVVDRVRVQDEVVFGDDDDVFDGFDQDFE
jgi:osmotically-inducible protein OsmY